MIQTMVLVLINLVIKDYYKNYYKHINVRDKIY